MICCRNPAPPKRGQHPFDNHSVRGECVGIVISACEATGDHNQAIFRCEEASKFSPKARGVSGHATCPAHKEPAWADCGFHDLRLVFSVRFTVDSCVAATGP